MEDIYISEAVKVENYLPCVSWAEACKMIVFFLEEKLLKTNLKYNQNAFHWKFRVISYCIDLNTDLTAKDWFVLHAK